jgi:hypothetical protein
VSDLDRQHEGTPPEGAPRRAAPPTKSEPAVHAHHDAPEAEASVSAEGLSREQLTHPANAARVAGLLGQLQQSHGNAYVQRLVTGLGGREAEHEGDAEHASHSSGEPLDSATKARMESAFGEDFGDVRVHADADAAKEQGARAFTSGADIYFDGGEYRPGTPQGMELLAHELTHVVQQRGGASVARDRSAGKEGDSFEDEATRASEDVMAGRAARVLERGATPSLQRQTPRPVPPATTMVRHPVIITPVFSPVTIDAIGWFTFTYIYTEITGAQFVILSLQVPEGVVTTPLDLSALTGDDWSYANAGGTAARTVSIRVNRNLTRAPLVQVDMTLGGRTYIVVFRFPGGTAAQPAPQPAPQTPPPASPGRR